MNKKPTFEWQGQFADQATLLHQIIKHIIIKFDSYIFQFQL